jgi:hypothetical protein
MPVNLAELKTELLTDPNGYGYAALIADNAAAGPLTNPVTIGLGNPIASFAAGQLSASLA